MRERLAFTLAVVSRYPLLSACALVLFARLAVLSGTGLSLDDLKYFDSLPPKEFLLSQGRFGWLLMDRVFYYLGIAGPYWYVHASLVGCALLACAGVMLARLSLGDQDARYTVSAVAVGVLFAIHPFHAEALSFREAFPFYTSAIFLSAVGLVTLERSRELRSWILGVALITLAISVYQLVLNVMAAVLLFRMISEIGSGVRLREILQRRSLLSMLGGSIVGTGVFLVTMKLLVMAFGITPDSRAQPLPLAELPQRMAEVLSTVWTLVRFELLVPAPLLTALLTLLASIACVRVLVSGANGPARGALLVLLLLVPFASIGVVGAGSVYWPAPRTLVGFAFATAMLVVLATRRPATQLVLPAMFALVTVFASFCIIGDTVALDQNRVNGRDRHTAALIDARIGGLGKSRIAFVGDWKHGVNVRTRDGDMSLSAFAVAWSRAPALTEYTGRNWEVVDSSGRSDWTARCQLLEKWPHADAHFVEGDIAVVCL